MILVQVTKANDASERKMSQYLGAPHSAMLTNKKWNCSQSSLLLSLPEYSSITHRVPQIRVIYHRREFELFEETDVITHICVGTEESPQAPLLKAAVDPGLREEAKCGEQQGSLGNWGKWVITLPLLSGRIRGSEVSISVKSSALKQNAHEHYKYTTSTKHLSCSTFKEFHQMASLCQACMGTVPMEYLASEENRLEYSFLL